MLSKLIPPYKDKPSNCRKSARTNKGTKIKNNNSDEIRNDNSDDQIPEIKDSNFEIPENSEIKDINIEEPPNFDHKNSNEISEIKMQNCELKARLDEVLGKLDLILADNVNLRATNEKLRSTNEKLNQRIETLETIVSTQQTSANPDPQPLNTSTAAVVNKTKKEQYHVLILSDSIYRHVGIGCPKKDGVKGRIIEKDIPVIFQKSQPLSKCKKFVCPGSRCGRIFEEAV